MDFQDPQHLLIATKLARQEYLKYACNTSISAQQAESGKERPVVGPIWVSQFKIAKPTRDNSRDVLLGLIDESEAHRDLYAKPESAELNFEWVGFRRGADKKTPEPRLSETEKFAKLEAETTRPLIVLYIHGGVFAFNSPSSYRPIVGSLARGTGGKILMVRQRLAPQNPFPAALLDVFQAYLTLLAPPAGAPHEAVPPSSIVIAGDSSGANIAMALLQVLLRLKRRNAQVQFHNHNVKVELPSGMAFLSPWMDLSNSLPSHDRNAQHDIYSPPPVERLPYLDREFPTCSIWPASPPRVHLYCAAAMFTHPLVSPAAADDWTGSCPLWMCSGQEQIADGSRHVAQLAYRQGVSVVLQEYEGMPHTFPLIFRQAPQSRKMLNDWTHAILSFVGPQKPASSAVLIHAKGLRAEPMDMTKLVPFSPEEVKETMRRKISSYHVPAFHRQRKSVL